MKQKKGYLDLEVSEIKAIFITRKITRFYSVSGYGRKIPTQYMIQTSDNRLHRVYCVCYSNSGSIWINYKGARPMVESAMNEYNLERGITEREYPEVKK